MLKKIKYVDGESRTLTEEDEGIFKAMITDDQLADKQMQEEGAEEDVEEGVEKK